MPRAAVARGVWLANRGAMISPLRAMGFRAVSAFAAGGSSAKKVLRRCSAAAHSSHGRRFHRVARSVTETRVQSAATPAAVARAFAGAADAGAGVAGAGEEGGGVSAVADEAVTPRVLG